MIYAQPQGEDTISELQDQLRKASDAKWYRRLRPALADAGDCATVYDRDECIPTVPIL